MGTEMGQLSSVHLTGLGWLVAWEKVSGMHRRRIEIRYRIVVSLQCTEIRGL